MLSANIPGHAHRLSSRSPAKSRTQHKLYFPPGGHTHDRHTIPLDQLHISLSDPVLVAAEQCLSDVFDDQKCAATKTPKLELPLFDPSDGILSQLFGAINVEAVDPLAMATISQATSPEPGFQEIADHSASSPSESCDISELATIRTAINGYSGDEHCSALQNSRYAPDLAPLASEMFKQELYIRGYLKRPASRSSNVVPRKSRVSLLFGSRSIFPRVLGRRQGRKLAECLKADQDAAEIPSNHDGHLSEHQPSPSVGLITPRTPRTQGIQSPDTSTSASDLFDLHEFSYITAFTTPPSSPSIVLGAGSKKGVVLGDSKHVV